MDNKSEVLKELQSEFNCNDKFDVLLGEKLFLILNDNDWNYDVLTKGDYSKYLSFGVPSYYISEYLINKVGLSGEELVFMLGKVNQVEKKFKEQRKSVEFSFYDKLVETKSEDDIVKLFNAYGDNFYFDTARIYRNVLDYVISKNLVLYKRDQLHSLLKEKLDIYSKYRRKKNLEKARSLREQEEKLLVDEGKKIVLEYMQSEYDNRMDFCNETGIELSYFNKLLTIIEKYDKEFYEKYSLFSKEKRSMQFKSIIKNLNSIIDGIANGVKVEDGVRSYDLLDYCLTTNLSLDEFFDLCKEINLRGEKLRKVRAFIQKNINVGSKKTKTVLDEKLIIGGREITKSDKEYVLGYLKDNHIVFNEKVYMIALRRYLKGELNEVEKKKVKKK